MPVKLECKPIVKAGGVSGGSWETTNMSWTKTDYGYRLGLAVLARKGRTWILAYCGHVIDLGRKATFDTAERELARLGA